MLLLLDNLQEVGDNWIQRNAIWAGVKLGGGVAAWDQHDPVYVAKMKQYAIDCGKLFTMPSPP